VDEGPDAEAAWGGGIKEGLDLGAVGETDRGAGGEGRELAD
jgi:hypothetical protein